jgi:hypothetical protein
MDQVRIVLFCGQKGVLPSRRVAIVGLSLDPHWILEAVGSWKPPTRIKINSILVDVVDRNGDG